MNMTMAVVNWIACKGEAQNWNQINWLNLYSENISKVEADKHSGLYNTIRWNENTWKLDSQNTRLRSWEKMKITECQQELKKKIGTRAKMLNRWMKLPPIDPNLALARWVCVIEVNWYTKSKHPLPSAHLFANNGITLSTFKHSVFQ